MANEKWLDILKMSEIEADERLITGSIKSVKVNKPRKAWRLCIEFKSLIPWSQLNDIIVKINAACCKEFDLKEILFTVSYQDKNIDMVMISEYYRGAIDICKKKITTVEMLKEYPYIINNNNILIKVAGILDKNNVLEHLPLVKAFFANYGLEYISFNVEISEEEISLKDIHKEERRIKESQYEAKSMEEYYKRRAEAQADYQQNNYQTKNRNQPVMLEISDIPMNSIDVEEFRQTRLTNKVEITGVIVKNECRAIKTKDGREFNLFEGIVTDYKDAVIIKRFYRDNDKKLFECDIKSNQRVIIVGNIQWDDYAKEVIVMCDRLTICGNDPSRIRFDGAPHKRIELHAHTKMSVLDSVLDINEYIDAAKSFGHTAIAVTDHANCHIFPEFFKLAKKANIKPIAGVEGYYVDDESFKITLTNEDIDLTSTTYVIFDIETTGLCIGLHEIIELGAIKVQNGLIIDTFSHFVKPKSPITPFISNLTNITNDQVKDAEPIEALLPKLIKFFEGSVLVAHNGSFDMDYIYANLKKYGLYEKDYPCIDTLQLARVLYGGLIKQFNLKAVAKYLKAEIEQQHRAIFDARTTNNIFMRMLSDLYDKNIRNYRDLNGLIDHDKLSRYVIPSHINILIKNKVGLKNFYKIISDSHTTHFQREARVLKSVIKQNREGLLIGSGCVNGEIFRCALEKTYDQLLSKITFYDYIEVQPISYYKYLFEKSGENSEVIDTYLKNTIKLIIQAAKEKNIPVVATGDVHQLIKDDSEYRSIYLSVARPNGGGPHALSDYKPIDMYYRTTSEMLEEFSFLPSHLASEIVIDNTNLISNQIEEYELFPNQLYVPRDDFMFDKNGVASMKEAVNNISYETAYRLYGNPLPLYIKERLEKELNAIIGNGFASVYYISHLLVKNSNDAGYIVGSRGSVGSSFVATMMNITEVNPLKPHYRCPKCQFTRFKLNVDERKKYQIENVSSLDDALQNVYVGMDLPNNNCPRCGYLLEKDGIDIAFETFMGFNGEKVPDIDLNFSGEYQAEAHLFCLNTFGIDHAFRAGTISTVMDKTAFAYVRDYYNSKGIEVRKSNKERIANFIAGSKRTTGQHPGGIIVVPDDIEYTDIIPVQYPPTNEADLADQKWRTSHYDYHSFESNLLKLDILGHDDPTMIKTLLDYVKSNPQDFPFLNVEEIPYIDDKVLSLFSSKEVLNLNGDDNDSLNSGTIGIPEFGTNFVRGMLETIKPKSYNDIIKVSGLSHGTDVWNRNAEDLFKGTNPLYPPIPFNEVIGCRDDIMIYLMGMNLPALDAFNIMEAVRKGRGLTKEQENLMKKHGVPEWYIYSCNKIKYMFPKAHATAYVIMALRIGWFKVYRPIYYYATYFSKRAKEVNIEVFVNGKNAIRNKINDIEKAIKNRTVTTKEEDLLPGLRIALEMTLRGFTFKQININKSDSQNYVISEDKKSLYMPFIAVESLGGTVAESIVEARNIHPFTSKSDLELRTNINKTQYAKLKTLGVLDELPDNDTLL